jgi:hypothetical protein
MLTTLLLVSQPDINQFLVGQLRERFAKGSTSVPTFESLPQHLCEVSVISDSNLSGVGHRSTNPSPTIPLRIAST